MFDLGPDPGDDLICVPAYKRVQVPPRCFPPCTRDLFGPRNSQASIQYVFSILCVLFMQLYSDNTPAVALFATNARYKREAYRGSEFAPRILAENGIDVVMKVLQVGPVLLYSGLTCSQSDHPVLNSRFLLFEAQQAYYYGLSANLALSAVTSTPAKVLGLDHRIGFIREGVCG